jgi:two-component system LytT family sensor kinase
MNTKQLLQDTIIELKKLLGNTSRKVVVILCVTQLICANGYYLSQKITTGRFFYHYSIGVANCSLSLFCLFTAIYYYRLLNDKPFVFISKIEQRYSFSVEIILKWILCLSSMIYITFVMCGSGNINSDTLLFEFSLGLTLIFIISMILGKNIALLWTIIVVFILFFVYNDQNGSVRYNYLTPAESQNYEAALLAKKKWAIEREQILTKNNLKPPLKTKYVIQWFFILVAGGIIAYFYNGTSHKVFNLLPSIYTKLEEVIKEHIKNEKEHISELNIVEGQKLLLKQESLKSELNVLKAQINPHFLYNMLNYFYVKSYDHSLELAESIRKLSDIMRYSLNDTNDLEVDLLEDIRYVKLLISLNQVRYDNSLPIKYEEHIIYPQKVLPLILITLVENSFKHGKLNDPKTPLSILVKTDKKSMYFLISNKKKSTNHLKKTTRLGLQNIKNRLDLFYKNNYKMTITEDEYKYSCELIIFYNH